MESRMDRGWKLADHEIFSKTFASPSDNMTTMDLQADVKNPGATQCV